MILARLYRDPLKLITGVDGLLLWRLISVVEQIFDKEIEWTSSHLSTIPFSIHIALSESALLFNKTIS